MDPNTMNILISAIAGLVAGHGTGAAAQNTNLGPVGNTATGAVGGVLGGLIGAMVPALQQIGSAQANGANIGAGAIGGIILTAIIGYLKNQMANKA